MAEFIRDQIWEFVGVVISVVATLVTVATFLIERRKKAFACKVYSTGRLLGVSYEAEGDGQIMFEEPGVHDIHPFIVIFANTGNVPVLPADYQKSPSLNFGENANVLGAEIVKTDLASIDATIRSCGPNLSLVPTLLNGGDTITAAVLVSGYNGDLSIDGRIVGIREIKTESAVALNTSTKVSLLAGVAVALTAVAIVVTRNYSLAKDVYPLICDTIELVRANSLAFPWLMMLAACLIVLPALADRIYFNILMFGRLWVGFRVRTRDLLFPILEESPRKTRNAPNGG